MSNCADSNSHSAREGHKIGEELRHHHFHQAHTELLKELHAHPHQFNKILKSINHDLRLHHLGTLKIHHDHGKHISHIEFGKHEIYKSAHHDKHGTAGDTKHAKQHVDANNGGKPDHAAKPGSPPELRRAPQEVHHKAVTAPQEVQHKPAVQPQSQHKDSRAPHEVQTKPAVVPQTQKHERWGIGPQEAPHKTGVQPQLQQKDSHAPHEVQNKPGVIPQTQKPERWGIGPQEVQHKPAVQPQSQKDSRAPHEVQNKPGVVPPTQKQERWGIGPQEVQHKPATPKLEAQPKVVAMSPEMERFLRPAEHYNWAKPHIAHPVEAPQQVNIKSKTGDAPAQQKNAPKPELQHPAKLETIKSEAQKSESQKSIKPEAQKPEAQKVAKPEPQKPEPQTPVKPEAPKPEVPKATKPEAPLSREQAIKDRIAQEQKLQSKSETEQIKSASTDRQQQRAINAPSPLLIERARHEQSAVQIRPHGLFPIVELFDAHVI